MMKEARTGGAWNWHQVEYVYLSKMSENMYLFIYQDYKCTYRYRANYLHLIFLLDFTGKKKKWVNCTAAKRPNSVFSNLSLKKGLEKYSS